MRKKRRKRRRKVQTGTWSVGSNCIQRQYSLQTKFIPGREVFGCKY